MIGNSKTIRLLVTELWFLLRIKYPLKEAEDFEYQF